jgi:hypothetical protein
MMRRDAFTIELLLPSEALEKQGIPTMSIISLTYAQRFSIANQLTILGQRPFIFPHAEPNLTTC